MARKTVYKPELVDEVCERLANGETLVDICKSPHMPSKFAIYDWSNGVIEAIPADVSADIKQRIARARWIGYDVIANRLRSVARGGEGSSGDVDRDKLIIHTDSQLLAKWCPQVYGDRKIVQGDSEADAIKFKGEISEATGTVSRILKDLAAAKSGSGDETA